MDIDALGIKILVELLLAEDKGGKHCVRKGNSPVRQNITNINISTHLNYGRLSMQLVTTLAHAPRVGFSLPCYSPFHKT